MKEGNQMSRIQELETIISEASQKYYTDNSSHLSDAEFDAYVEELRSLDPTNPILTAVGWGYKTGEKGAKHHYDLITGIDNKITVEPDTEVIELGAIFAPKLDGSSIVCYYKNGHFYQAITRGDGDVGMDVTHNVYNKVPNRISGFTGYVRCEAVVSYTNFKNHFDPSKSIRNIAAGIIGAKSKKPNLEYVDLVPIGIYRHTGEPQYRGSRFYGDVVFARITEDFEHKVDYIETEGSIIIGEDTLAKLSDYPCDGLVCYIHDQIFAAYKYNTDYGDAVVMDIEWRTQTTGRIFPLIHVEEVQMADCKVNKVSGKSGELIVNSKLGKGSIIEIVRSGDVIPNFTGRILGDADEVSKPSCSYRCDDENVVAHGANYFCINPHCPCIYDGAVTKMLHHFSPKGFSDEMANMMLDDYKIRAEAVDVSNITPLHVLLIECQAGKSWETGTKHQQKLINQTLDTLRKRQMSLYDLVTVCSIDGFGKTLSKALEPYLYEECKRCNLNVSDYLSNKLTFTAEEVNNSKARASWQKRYDLLCDVLSVFNIILPVQESKNEESKGTVCITGKLSTCTKKEFNAVITDKGYEQVDSVSKTLTILICNKAGSSKAKKAEKYGVNVITEQDFIDNY
tara:strand:- start:3590 stop:5458 length:1869 start_codon:yes stop_codon:yes gene_type:complete